MSFGIRPIAMPTPLAAPLASATVPQRAPLSARLAFLSLMALTTGCVGDGEDTIPPLNPPPDAGMTADATARKTFDECFPPTSHFMFFFDVMGISYPSASPIDGAAVFSVNRQDFTIDATTLKVNASLTLASLPTKIDASNALRVQSRLNRSRLADVWFGTQTWGDVYTGDDRFGLDFGATFNGANCSFHEMTIQGAVVAYLGDDGIPAKDFADESLVPEVQMTFPTVRPNEASVANLGAITNPASVSLTMLVDKFSDGGADAGP